ncbi:hypothetical protein BH23ACT11_BH23ACT11_04100 [soil metagenome]
MTLMVTSEPIPLSSGRDGAMRVGDTRVTVDTVVAAFCEGATAEEISQQYPSLGLADVYAVIGYYLRHQAEVEGYLRQQQQKAADAYQTNEVRFDPAGLRGRLLARSTK